VDDPGALCCVRGRIYFAEIRPPVTFFIFGESFCAKAEGVLHVRTGMKVMGVGVITDNNNNFCF
jgi:hypothetical protein